jgi:uncharacterized protein YecE (DUF72 family)
MQGLTTYDFMKVIFSMTKPLIGTSGWQYPDFSERFYPEGLDKTEQLSYYALNFPSVEVNNTFYQLPQAKTIQKWVDQTPDDFVFAIKASRYITHMKNLMEPEQTLPNFFERISHLKEKCGPILFQLPPHWQINLDRFENFLDHLPEDYRYTFEFRNETWFEKETYTLLRQHKAAFCIYDFNFRQSPRITTADLVYIRLHGPGKAYQDPYDEDTLKGWRDRISSWLEEDKQVYCYFDNTYRGHAWKNAKKLLSLLED